VVERASVYHYRDREFQRNTFWEYRFNNEYAAKCSVSQLMLRFMLPPSDSLVGHL
jgi:hypothetical protein